MLNVTVKLFVYYIRVLMNLRETWLSFSGVCAVSFNCRWHWFRYGLLYPGEANRSLSKEVDRDIQRVPKPG
jgi:hypothetical protein